MIAVARIRAELERCSADKVREINQMEYSGLNLADVYFTDRLVFGADRDTSKPAASCSRRESPGLSDPIIVRC